MNAKGQKIMLKGKKKSSGQVPTSTFTGTIYAANSKLEIKGFADDEDPASLEDIDESNDPVEGDDLTEPDPDTVQNFTKSVSEVVSASMVSLLLSLVE